MKKVSVLKLFSLVAFAAAGAFAVANGVSHKKAESVSAGDKVRVTLFVDDPDNNFWCEANAISAVGCSDDVSGLYFFENRDTDFSTTTIKGNTTLWSQFHAIDPGNDWSGTIKGTTALIEKSLFGTTWSLTGFQVSPDLIHGACAVP